MISWMLQNAASVALLTAAVALVCKLCRLSPPLRHALWLIVLVKLMTPPLVSWHWSIPDVTSYLRRVIPVSDQSVAGSTKSFAGLTESTAVREFGQETRGASGRIVDSGKREKAKWREVAVAHWAQSVGLADRRRLIPALFGVWLLGALALAVRQMAEILRFWRRLARAKPAPELEIRLLGIASQLQVKCPKVVILADLKQPFLWCIGRPMLVWPATLDEPFLCQSGRSVMAHELAHLRRRDHWVCWLTLFAGWLWWWYPLYWYVHRKMEENAELSCDAWAVWFEPNSRRAYAEAVVEVWKQGAPAIGSVPAFITGRAPHKLLERRLRMIMRANVPRKLSAYKAVLVALVAAMVLPIWSASPGEGERKAKEGESAATPRLRDGEGPARSGPRDGEGSRVAGTREGEGTRRRVAREGDVLSVSAPREGGTQASTLGDFKPDTPREAELYRMVLQLERELKALRQELNQLRTAGPERRRGDLERPVAATRPERSVSREGDRPAGSTNAPREGDSNVRRGVREGDRSPEALAPAKESPERDRRSESGEPAKRVSPEGERR